MAVAPEELEAHVKALAGEIGERNVFRPQALQAAADYIEGQWRSQGYRVVAQNYQARGRRCANLEIERKGKVWPSAILLIGAHYDSVVGSPGANDNGSGVAAMLEISRLFAAAEPAMTVRFVAFVNEEPPFFFWKDMGSLVYAQQAKARGDDIRLMISLETIGCYSDVPGSQRYPALLRFFYPDRGNFIAFVSNFHSRRVMHRVAAAFRAHSDFPAEHAAAFSWLPGIAWSDHYSFWRQGYRALMVTDTAFYRYPYYHTAEDTPDKLDYPRLGEVTEGLWSAFASLASGEW
ncbi:MAG: M28 family peptidase [Pseudomonadota bacterium]|jgi:Zn-dependent M28 family amino/carboxypeptidase